MHVELAVEEPGAVASDGRAVPASSVRHAPTSRELAGWRIESHRRIDSTQHRARELPAWSAVAASEQMSGRGQGVRTFVSDPGGLYVSAALPYAGDPLRARGFALAVGWALREALRRAGVWGLRLRWPNDLMIGSRKVGGILVEQGRADTLVVGVGLNVFNRPWRADPALRTVAGRLADHWIGGTMPSRARLLEIVLRAIRAAHVVFPARKLAGMVPVLNRCWGRARQVELELVPGGEAMALLGLFAGIDPTGRVILRGGDGRVVVVPEHHIRRLREIA